MDKLPILDVSAYRHDPTGDAGQAFVAALRDACHGPGFCYVEGHGVPAELDASVLREAAEFFALPQSERHELAIGKSPHFRGYTILGDERTQGRRDWRDQIDIGPEEPALALAPNDPPWLKLRGPNQWPTARPGMRDVVVRWMEEMNRVGTTIMQALARGLGQSPDVFDDAISPNPYPRVKVIRYPARDEEGYTGQGLGLHQDSGLLSFILQDDVGGLQVETSGGLLDATPRAGAYIMNLGEMLQAATGGYLRATRHQVMSPPAGKQRISIAFFFNPRLDAVFSPLSLPPELATAARGGQNDDPSDPVFATFGENTLKIRMRAHPDVTAAFYTP